VRQKISRTGDTGLMSQPILRAVLESAVKIEEQSYALYTNAQGKAELESSIALLSELARAELSHKEKLLAVTQDRAAISRLGSSTGRIEDLKIVDFMEDAVLSENADFRTILIFAAKREKSTCEHYRSLAKGLFARHYPTVGLLFAKLAEEESIHKNRLEREYVKYEDLTSVRQA
jgi:rubrerythrin